MFKNAIRRIEKFIDKLKIGIKKRFNLFDPIIIYPYHGFANEHEVSLTGRVLEQQGILDEFNEPKNIFSKIWYMILRYESDELPFLKLKITVDGNSVETTTNEEGFYHINIPYDGNDKTGWQKAYFEVAENPYTNQKNITATGEFIVAGKQSDLMIISDVDDTILKSFATNTYLKIKTLVFNNASSRVAFEGVPKLYQNLQANPDGRVNPLFFVSGSSWNLYDLLDRFCRTHDIPKAPFFLREMGIDNNMFIQHKTHDFKLNKIKELLEFYPNIPVVFIGDSGQKDPEVYHKLAMENPGRVKAIFIRQISPGVNDDRKKMIEELKKHDTDLIFVDHSDKIKNYLKQEELVDKY